MECEAGPSTARADPGPSKPRRQAEEGASTRASSTATEKRKAKDEGHAVPFEYFASLLKSIAAINQAEWPYHSTSQAEDRKYRQELEKLESKPGKSSSKTRLLIRKQAVTEVTYVWIQQLPAGKGPGPQVCQPGTTEAVFRLLFPEEDVRRRFKIKESTMIRHLARALNDDKAISALYAWNKSDAASEITTGSGCLAIEFLHQLELLGHEDESQSTSAGGGASKTPQSAEDVWGPLTVQHVDILLDELAAGCSFTDESILSCWDTNAEPKAKDDITSTSYGKQKAPQATQQRKPKKVLNVLDRNRKRNPRFQPIAEAKEGPHPHNQDAMRITHSNLMPSFQLPSERPSRNARRKARPQSQILDFLLGPAVCVQSRAFLIQIILKDLGPVLYPLPQDKATKKVLEADRVLSEHNTNSVSELSLHTAMQLWHPAMPNLWRVRYGSSFEAIGREIERLWWSTPKPARSLPPAEEALTLSTSIQALPELFTFVQMPKSLKATSCVDAAAHFRHAGVIWAEQKYDGERFQVHVNFSNADEQPELKIFSKSQRDSTLDRSQTHAIVLAALGRDPALSRHAYNSQLSASVGPRSHLSREGNGLPPKRRVSHSVILEAEMVAFDADGELAEFHKIAKIKDRAGMPRKGIDDAKPSRTSSDGPAPSMENRFRHKLKSAHLKLQTKEQREKARQEQQKRSGLIPGTSDSETGQSDNEVNGSYTSLPSISQISDLTVSGSFHLGLVFFDVLYVDGESLIARTYDDRRAVLESIIRPIPSFAILAERTKIDFGPTSRAEQRKRMLTEGMLAEGLNERLASKQLQSVLENDMYWQQGMKALIGAFAQSYARREEGLMLKAADAPYIGGLPHPGMANSNGYAQFWMRDRTPFQHESATGGHQYRAAWIKLKADYIDGLGDTVDMAVIGAGWSVKRARELRVGTDGFTTFYLAARLPGTNGRPRLRCWTVAEYGTTRSELASITSRVQTGGLKTVDFNTKNMRDLPYDLELGMGYEPTILFPEPMLVEVVGGGFSKNPGDEFYMLRWPRIKKFFSAPDRTWTDAIEFEEMQRSAVKAVRKLECESEMEEAFETRALRITQNEGLAWMRKKIKSGKGPSSWQVGGRRSDVNDGFPPAKKRKLVQFAVENQYHSPLAMEGMPSDPNTLQAGPSVLLKVQPSHSDDSLAGALDRDKKAEQRRIVAGLDKKIRALQHRGVVPQLLQDPEDAVRSAFRGKHAARVQAGTQHPPSPPTSSPLRSGTETVPSYGRAGAAAPPPPMWDHSIPQPLPSPIVGPVDDDLPVPVITPPSSGQPAAAAPEQMAAPGISSASALVPPSPPAPSTSKPSTNTAPPKPRTCMLSPRLLDAAIYFHCNIPKESVDLLSGMLMQNVLLNSMEALIDSLIPIQASAQRVGHSGVPGQPRLTRSRSFQKLSGTTVEDRQRCGIVVMDTSDQEACHHMHEEIRQRVALIKRRMAPSLSAPTGLSIQGSSTATTSHRPALEVRRCLNATSAHLARHPIVLIDVKAVDQLVFEQWECVEQCAAQGPAAAAGDCECCPHIDCVLTAMAVQDSHRVRDRSKPAPRVSDRY
ncbi:unnamed protein product [Tilletia laevis]|uniref:ATP-dependent DNA ligase family profile domain-containing protein n=2 Tax=Tilletia TaxID=13289 RepID=A0A177VEG7_9BASI|nr:hypothetical protein CF336_g5 [Tilletia laevis]KAE8264781.1 hypothetical protein A4X03_0g714 [Tilletia caries]KAE8208975.1 hypothetical protein CF335_g5 [Tilletia laevis]CAD6883877.1 unnamed protein product [Tilletia caries]CAD6902316.1 unnamed protein product [Tilletia laevis]